MATLAADQEARLGTMWEAHRHDIRRLLLSLARDLDRADDLLQETYLAARAGIGSYRGGDARAWLAAIARNAFRMQVRRRGYRAEVSLEEHAMAADLEAPACDLHELLALRQMLAALPEALRIALIMKHYAGYTYQEIAHQQNCPVGTAKWRVSEALGRLRQVLLPERSMAMTEAGDHGFNLVDYAYGVMSSDDAAKVAVHIKACSSCRTAVTELQQVVTLLNTADGEHKQMHFIELDAKGVLTLHVASSHVNLDDEAVTTWQFQSGKTFRVEHFYQDGEEATLKIEPCEFNPDLESYTVTLPHPVAPGQRVNELLIYPSCITGSVQKIAEGHYRFDWKQGPGSNVTAYIQALRLPLGARLVSATPQPAETRTNGVTTLVWRKVLNADEFFECTVEYRLNK
jgi:RNA polymerase sigma-70 factor, ECF subfamily